MTHSDELLRRYLDGELTLRDAARLNEHLSACARCRSRLAALERIVARLADLEQLAPAPDFAARVAARLAAQPRQRRARPWYPALLCALAGLLGVIAAVDETFALAGGLIATMNSVLDWLLAPFGADAGLGFGRTDWLGAGVQPALVVGLCLLALASALVLRQSLASQAET